MYKKAKERISTKWAFVSLSVLFSGLVFSSFSAAVLLDTSTDPDSQEVARGYITKNNASVKNYDIAYPVFHAKRVDTLLRNYVTHRVDSFWDKLGDRKSDPRNFLRITYTLVHMGSRTATVTFHEQKQLFDKSPSSSQTNMSFDLERGNRLTFVDLFKERKAAEALLARILHDYFQHETPGQLTADELRQYHSFTLETIQDFALNEGVVVLYLNLHGDSPMSIKTVAIKKELLAGVLREEFAASDAKRVQSNVGRYDYFVQTLPPHRAPIDPRGKMLALTFDDGPGPLTSQVLDTLERYGARGTFFVIGRQVPGHAAELNRMVREGHEVGNHTWDHPNLTLVSLPELGRQIDRTQQVIQQVTGGYTPTLLRPPQEAFNSAVTAFATTRGLNMALWNVDTLDWLDRNAELIYQRIMASRGDSNVILVHDIHPTSVDAVTRAIPQLIAEGYQLVTFSELERYR